LDSSQNWICVRMEKKLDYNYKKFEDLKIYTSTVMVYSNVNFNQLQIFCNTPIFHLDPPLTKKKKNIEKKKLRSPYATIISMQYYPPKENCYGIYFRGLRLSKKKTYWCPICQLYEENGDEIATIVEEECFVNEENIDKYINEIELETYPSDTKKILFHCTSCERYLEFKQLLKIVPFLNQVTIVVSMEDMMVNVMMFKNICKVAGNKSFTDACEIIMILWEEYIRHDKSLWSINNTKQDAHFLFDTVMVNVDFAMGFPIDKCKLNSFMQRKELKDIVYISQYEPTSSTHVNIKMYSPEPDNFSYQVLVYEENARLPYFATCNQKLYSKVKPNTDKYTTFIVFSSSKIILTGRYQSNMKINYEHFIKTANENKSEILETIQRPKISIIDYLKQIEKNNI
jgi:hypothetical protein